MLIKKINLMEVGNNLRALPKLDINLIKRILKSFLCNVLIPFISLLTCSFLNIQLRVTFEGAKEERTDDRIAEEVGHTKLRAKVVSVIFTLIIEVIGAENHFTARFYAGKRRKQYEVSRIEKRSKVMGRQILTIREKHGDAWFPFHH